MKFVQIIATSTRIFFQNKVIWLLGCSSLLFSLARPVLVQFVEANPVFAFLGLIVIICFWALYQILEISLIYTVSQNLQGISIVYREAITHGKKYFWKISWLVVLLVPIFLFASFLSRQLENRVGLELLVAFFVIMFSALMWYGSCAIVIHETKPLAALWTGLLITTNNLGFQVAFYIFIPMILFSFKYLLFMVAFLLSHIIAIPELADLNIQTMLNVAAFSFFYRLFGWIITIWTSVVFTVAYNKFTQLIEYPALVQKPEAT
jgi:hypothetical protein